MSKTKKRQVFAEERVFSAQEFETSGIRELSFEELLEVNGGRQVKDDPRTDRNSDVCRSSGRSSRGNSSGSSSRGSSSSGGSSSRGGSSGSYGSSSSSKGASGGRSSSPSKGSSSSGFSGRGSSAHDSSSKRNTGSSKGSVSSGSASGSSSKNSQSSSSGETKPSNPSKPDRKEERSSTVGGGSSGNTSFGRNTGSSGGGGSFDRSSPSRDRDSSDRDSSRSDRYSSGSSVSSGSTVYTPPVQSQPVPAPAAEKTTAPVQSQVQSEQNKNTSVSAPQNSAEPNRGEGKASLAGSVVPRVETAASARAGIAATGSSSSAVSVPPVQSQPAPASAAEKEAAPVQSQVQSEKNKEASVSSLQNSAEPNKGEESSPTQGGVAPQGEAAATVQNQGKNAGAANSGTKGGVLSGFKEFWGNAGNGIKNTAGKIWDKFGNVNKTNAESYVEKSRGGSWQSKENFPVPTAQGSNPRTLLYWSKKEGKKVDYSKTEARYGSFPNGPQEETTAWGWQHSLSKNTKKHINQLHPEIQTATKNMMVNLYNKGVKTEIVCSVRTSAEQDRLYNIGRDSEGNVVGAVVTYVKGGESFHNFGLAFDVEVYNKNGKKNWDSKSVDWQTVVAEGQVQGFEAGATWKNFNDFPHFQNAFNLSTKQLRDRLVNNQMQGGWVSVK